MSASHVTTVNSAQESDQTGTGCQYVVGLESMFEDINLGRFGNYEPSGPLPGGSDMYLAPTRLVANMANQSPGFNNNIGTLPTPFMNYGFDLSIASHMATHQYQWDTGIHFPISNPSQNNFAAPYANRADLSDPVRPHHQSSSAFKNRQCNIPQFRTWLLDGENGAPAQPPTTPGTSLGIQYRAYRRTLPGPATSQNGLQANRDTTAVPFYSWPEPIGNTGVRSSSTNNFAPNELKGSSFARLDAIKPPNQAIGPPRTDRECAPALTEVNPKSGSITGGATIWLQGINFSAHFPLFARFGTAVVPTTFSNHILVCNLPSATAPGVVDVTLSEHPEQNAPKYGTSIAKFHYLADYEQLIPMVLRVHAHGYPEVLPALQTLLTALKGNHGSRGLQGGSHGAGPRDDSIETALVDVLSFLQTRPNFNEVLSTTNEYSQTFAHLSILYGFPSLLRHLVEWCIDLAISDVNGLTALHCAFMKGDLDSVRILRQGGASETVTDKLGRTPSELGPKGFGSAISRDGRATAGLDTRMCMGKDNNEEQQLSRLKKPAAAPFQRDPLKLEQSCRQAGGSAFAVAWIIPTFKHGVTAEALLRKLERREIDEMNLSGSFEPHRAYDGFISKVGDRYECGLCKEGKRTWWKHKVDAPRHLRRIHFGLADVCKNCGKHVFSKGEMKAHRCPSREKQPSSGVQ